MAKWLVLVLASCLGKDEGGCPFAGREAVGERCRDEGHACGESSLCDPCTSDLSECESIVCVNGVWEVDPPPTVCDEP